MFDPRSFLRVLALVPMALPSLTAHADQSDPSSPRITPELVSEIETLMPQAMSTFDIPGAALALIQDGAVVYARGFGVRDLATGAPFTADTIHRIGSTTKSMTSMLVAIQVERGLFGWDTPVRQITHVFRFPTPELTRSITVRQTMGMGTGLGESPLEPYIDIQTPRVFRRTLTTLPVLAPPGSAFIYNDYVYAVAGYLGLLEQGVRVADLEQAYADTMKRELFDPIGMPTSAVTDDPMILSDNVGRSYGYDLRFGERPDQRQPYLPVRMVGPAGATATTLNEMARYLITQLNGGVTPNGRQLVARDILDATHQGQTKVSDVPAASYAMGWLPFTENGVSYIWHDGSLDGFKTDMTMLPQGKIGILVFANAETGEIFNRAIRDRIVELLYGLPATVVAAQEAAYASQKAAVHDLRTAVTAWQVPPEAVASYLGCYVKGWRVEYLDGLPMMTRASGVRLVLLPTAEGYRVGSTTYSNGFTYAVSFADEDGEMHLRITNPAQNGALIDDLRRCRPDVSPSTADLSGPAATKD